jgi:hypothetical protein
VGVVGSVTTAGRLVPFHVVAIGVAWSFVPVIHALTVAVVARLARVRLPVVRAVELHMAGNGPYLLSFFFVGGVVLLSPDVASTFRWLLDTAILPVVAGATIFSGGLTTYAFHRTCGGSTRRRALLLLGAEWLVKVVLCLAWYGLIDNLAPQFLGERAP